MVRKQICYYQKRLLMIALIINFIMTDDFFTLFELRIEFTIYRCLNSVNELLKFR